MPQTAQEYFEHGYARLGEEDYQAALRSFSRAVELDPRDPRYYRARARVYRVLENKERALADYSAAIELSPQAELARSSFFQKSLYELRAVVKKDLGDYRGAAEDLTKLILLNPASFRLYAQRAELYELAGNIDGAIEDITKAIEFGPSPSLYAGRAKLREKKGDMDGAMADCVQTLQGDPANTLCAHSLPQWRQMKERRALVAPPAALPGTIPALPEERPAREKPEPAPPELKPPETPPEHPKRAEIVAEKTALKPLVKATTPKEKGEGRYILQVATLVVEQNALSLKSRLEELGYAPLIRKVTAPITRHRVYGGEFSSRAAAEQAARHLQADGFPSTLIEEGEKFWLEVGSSLRLDDAINLARNLEKKNHPAKIVSQPVATPVHQVSVGDYADRAEALKALEALKRHGFTPLVVRR
jgi:tetratricopeptide (TPR) repeat protein